MTAFPLDPDAAAVAAAVADTPSLRERGIEAARASLEAAPHPPNLPVMAVTEDRPIPAPHGDIPLRVHRPTTDDGAPVIVYFHGGGMCMGSNHSFEPVARNLAHHSGAVVVAVEYRLAPEAPPPAQFDDAWAATAWVAGHADDLGVDPARLAVVGDSAGGTLAAAVALAARDRGGPALACQVLIYPGVDRDLAAPSITRYADAPILSRDDVLYLNALADAGQGVPDSPYRIPAYAADLSGLPPAIVVTGECDPIRDWGERYAARLREARVQTTLTRYPGVPHGFVLQADHLARGRLAVAETGALLRAKFAHPLPF
ncbi:alpha/beta hydrolase [Actinosynnema sp. NPDC004786]